MEPHTRKRSGCFFLSLALLSMGSEAQMDGTWHYAVESEYYQVPLCEKSVPEAGCSEVWLGWGSSCYWKAEAAGCTSYAAAKEHCKTEFHAGLAVITSIEENEVVRTVCGQSSCWLGLIGLSGDAGPSWTWDDGTATNSTILSHFLGNTPAVSGAAAFMNFDENLVAEWKRNNCSLASEGTWYVSGEDRDLHVPLCERAPLEKHTLWGHRASYCPDLWSLFEAKDGTHRRTCFRLFPEQQCVSQTAAVAQCKLHGALLAGVPSEAANEAVRAACGAHSCWLGLRRESQEWAWADGSNSSFAKWATGEPRDATTAQVAAFMNLGGCQSSGVGGSGGDELGATTPDADGDQHGGISVLVLVLIAIAALLVLVSVVACVLRCQSRRRSSEKTGLKSSNANEPSDSSPTVIGSPGGDDGNNL